MFQLMYYEALQFSSLSNSISETSFSASIYATIFRIPFVVYLRFTYVVPRLNVAFCYFSISRRKHDWQNDKKILGRFAENMYKNDRRHRPFLMDPQDNMIEGIIRNRWRDPKNDVTVTCHEASKR